MNMKQEAVISIQDLAMSYGYGAKQVLKGINLEVYPGQIIGYIGPNGAGKSTTVKILLGLVDDYQGVVKVFGEDIGQGGVAYKKRIGYVPETAEIYDTLTAQEYLTFIGEIYGMDYTAVDQKAQQLMGLLGIAEVYQARIASYSKGMKQKLLIIASLLQAGAACRPGEIRGFIRPDFLPGANSDLRPGCLLHRHLILCRSVLL